MTDRKLAKRFTKRRLEFFLLVDDKVVHSLKGTITNYSSGEIIVREEIDENGTKIEVLYKENLQDIYVKAEKMGRKKYGGRHSIRMNTYPYQE